MGSDVVRKQSSSSVSTNEVQQPCHIFDLYKKGIFDAQDLILPFVFTDDYKLVHSSRGGENPISTPMESGHGGYSNVCVIRFPPEVASVLNERLSCGEDLGLYVIQEQEDDFRYYDILVDMPHTVEGPTSLLPSGAVSRIKYRGILLELPCYIEGFKTIDDNLMFKSADISQILFVYHPDVYSLDLEGLRSAFYAFPHGITPATHSIVKRKFRNNELYETSRIGSVERTLLEMFSGNFCDSIGLDVQTLFELKNKIVGEYCQNKNVTVVPPELNLEDIIKGFDWNGKSDESVDDFAILSNLITSAP